MAEKSNPFESPNAVADPVTESPEFQQEGPRYSRGSYIHREAAIKAVGVLCFFGTGIALLILIVGILLFGAVSTPTIGTFIASFVSLLLLVLSLWFGYSMLKLKPLVRPIAFAIGLIAFFGVILAELLGTTLLGGWADPHDPVVGITFVCSIFLVWSVAGPTAKYLFTEDYKQQMRDTPTHNSAVFFETVAIAVGLMVLIALVGSFLE